jgi:hypothetical protein
MNKNQKKEKWTIGGLSMLLWAKTIWAGQREREIVFRISAADF